MRVSPRHRSLLPLLFVGALLPLSGCGTGDDNEIFVVPPIVASIQPDPPTPPTQTDRVVFFDNVTATGDVVNADLVVQDSTGTLDLDDIDLVLRYDATFLQVTQLRPETLFGNCGAVNPACLLVSPVCLNNQSIANGGGQRYCRSDGSTPCLLDTDCPATGDVCGDFGKLEASYAVITGPGTCSNNSGLSCTQSSQCVLCTANPTLPCTSAGDCSSTCASNICTGGSFGGQPCSSNADCVDTCASGTCSGCPSTVVNGKRRIVNVTFRVISEGTGRIHFVVSSNPLDPASFLRKAAVVEPGVQFWPSEDFGAPGIGPDAFVVMGTK